MDDSIIRTAMRPPIRTGWTNSSQCANITLVLDFGAGDFANIGLIEYWIANEEQAGYCGKYLFVFDGQTCPSHCHKTKHETFFIVRGKVRMRAGKRGWIMKPGDVFPVPRGSYHSFTGLGPALLIEISTCGHAFTRLRAEKQRSAQTQGCADRIPRNAAHHPP